MVDVGILEQIRRTGKVKPARPKQVAVVIAHGLAYDPHIDGRLRLTKPGLAKLRAATVA